MEAIQILGTSVPLVPLVPLLLLAAWVVIALLGKLLSAPFDLSDVFLKLVLASVVVGRTVVCLLR